MNEMMASQNLPHVTFHSQTFRSAIEYFEALATQKYSQSPFRLYCDDFRPPNVLMNLADFSVSGVIDWEFTNAAPAEFTTVAPWWLLLQSQVDWPEDLNEFLGCYKPPCFGSFWRP